MLLATYKIVADGDFAWGATASFGVETGLYRTKGNLNISHSTTQYVKDDNIQGFSLEKFNPILNNKTYTQYRVDTYIEENVLNLYKPFLSTSLAPLEETTFRVVEETPFYTEGIADFHFENLCTSNMAVYTAMNSPSPNYGLVNFNDIFKKVEGNAFTLYGDSDYTLYDPFYEVVVNQFSVTKNFVSFVKNKVLQDRINPSDIITSLTGDPMTVAPNYSLYRAASAIGKPYQQIYSTYSIQTPLSLKESDNPYEYNLRKSGFIGQVKVTIAGLDEITPDDVYTNYYQHTLFQIAPLFKEDTVKMLDPIQFQSTTFTINPLPSFLIYDLDFSIDKRTFCGADFFFTESDKKNITIKVSGAPAYSHFQNNIFNFGDINGTSSFILGNNDYVAFAARCLATRQEGNNDVAGGLVPLKNALRTMACYPSENLVANAYVGDGNNTRNYLDYANYLDQDHIFLAGAKSINTVYPISNFGRTDAGSIHNQFTTYWKNNIN